MRNQMTIRDSSITGLAYAAAGNLDGHLVELHAWSQGRITLDFGPCCLALSPAATIELIQHLASAMDAVVEAQEVGNA